MLAAICRWKHGVRVSTVFKPSCDVSAPFLNHIK